MFTYSVDIDSKYMIIHLRTFYSDRITFLCNKLDYYAVW